MDKHIFGKEQCIPIPRPGDSVYFGGVDLWDAAEGAGNHFARWYHPGEVDPYSEDPYGVQ